MFFTKQGEYSNFGIVWNIERYEDELNVCAAAQTIGSVNTNPKTKCSTEFCIQCIYITNDIQKCIGTIHLYLPKPEDLISDAEMWNDKTFEAGKLQYWICEMCMAYQLIFWLAQEKQLRFVDIVFRATRLNKWPIENYAYDFCRTNVCIICIT